MRGPIEIERIIIIIIIIWFFGQMNWLFEGFNMLENVQKFAGT